MRRFGLICAVLAIAGAAFAAPRTRSFTDKVVGGSLTITNNTVEGSAFELKRVEFSSPSATSNVFSIVQNRKFELPDNSWTRVTTNDMTDVVSTNYVPYTGGSAIFAFTNIVGTSATTVPVVYDCDDFDMGLTFEEEDIATFTFTYTNVFYLIRVYDVYPRP